jgi:hypothetical protein
MNSPRPGRWPDFLIIGAPKAGTTALFQTLSCHPQIFASAQKEPRFFICKGSKPVFPCPGGDSNVADIVWPEEAYLELFRDCPADARAGEASTAYLHHPVAPANAHARIPAARIIAVLRHPVDRAYSQWLHLRHEGLEHSADFATALGQEAYYKANGYWPAFYFLERGFYARQLERWLSYYPREQLLILFYEDWRAQPVATLKQVYRHLGIDDLDSPPLKDSNVSSREPRWKWLHHRMVRDNAIRRWAQNHLPLWMRDAITTPVRKINLKPGPLIDPKLRNRLTRHFLEDMQRLEVLTGRNLDHWKN